MRVNADRRASRVYRLAFARAGSRDDVRADRRRPTRHRRTRTSTSCTATRNAPVSAGHLRLAAARRSAAARIVKASQRRARKARRSRRTCSKRRRPTASNSSTASSPVTGAPTAARPSVRSRTRGHTWHTTCRSATGARPRRVHRVLRSDQLRYPAARTSARSRSTRTPVPVQMLALRAVRRLRQPHQPDDRRRAGTRRPRPRHRAGAATRKRVYTRPAARPRAARHGLRDAARRTTCPRSMGRHQSRRAPTTRWA